MHNRNVFKGFSKVVRRVCTIARVQYTNRFELLSARLSTNETMYKLTGDFWGIEKSWEFM